MKTQGEIEAAICEGITRFEQEYMGRGPKDIRAHLIGDLLVVRLQGVLTAAEQHLVKSLPAEKGRDLLKQVRTHLLETARPLLEAMVRDITGIEVLSLHHDISTVTGEEVVVFTLCEPMASARRGRSRTLAWGSPQGREAPASLGRATDPVVVNDGHVGNTHLPAGQVAGSGDLGGPDPQQTRPGLAQSAPDRTA
jgi:uncharacterized protein YbcI